MPTKGIYEPDIFAGTKCILVVIVHKKYFGLPLYFKNVHELQLSLVDCRRREKDGETRLQGAGMIFLFRLDLLAWMSESETGTTGEMYLTLSCSK